MQGNISALEVRLIKWMIATVLTTRGAGIDYCEVGALMSELLTSYEIDDILNRLRALQSSLTEVRMRVSAIEAVIPHLATKADLIEEIGSLRVETGRPVRTHLSSTTPHPSHASTY